jgi:hypothetical protein
MSHIINKDNTDKDNTENQIRQSLRDLFFEIIEESETDLKINLANPK